MAAVLIAVVQLASSSGASAVANATPQRWAPNGADRPNPRVMPTRTGSVRADQARGKYVETPGGPVGDVTYHGGPVMHTSVTYAIFWLPAGTSVSPDYQQVIDRYLSDVGGTSLYDVVTQYPDTNGPILDQSTFGGAWVDTQPFPRGRGAPNDPLQDIDIANEVAQGIFSNTSWQPPNHTRMYLVFLPRNVYLAAGGAESFESGGFCAYHSNYTDNERDDVIYAAMPDVGTDMTDCGAPPPYPNSDAEADSEISAVSHETLEAVTDPDSDNQGNPLGWAYLSGSGEIADMCNDVYTPRANDGSDVVLHGHPYIVQAEWSNADATSIDPSVACVSAFPHALDVVVPSSGATGAPVSVQIKAVDSFGRVTPGYIGTVQVTTSDPTVGPQSPLTFGPSDDGVKSLSLTFGTPGSDSITASDTAMSAITGTANLMISGPPTGKAIVRLAGADRIATAIAVSQNAFPTSGSADAVVLARSDGFADALAGAPLAAALRAPLLLTPAGQPLDSRTEAEIERVLASRSTVFILGGDSAVSPSVDRALASTYRVVRLAGPDRFATAAAIANQGLGNPNVQVITRGDDFADALAGGAAAAATHGAVLLTDGSTMPQETASYLAAHPGTRYALGGPAVAAAAGAGISVISVSGADRFATAVQAARTFFTSPISVGIAYGFNYPDALAGGAQIGARDGPLLLVDVDVLPSVVRSYLSSVGSSVTGAYVYGGTAVISDGDATAVREALG